MAKLALAQFVGANSSIGDKLLPEQFAVEATNVFTDTGSLNVFRIPKQVGISPVWNTKTGNIQSLYKLENRWLAFTEQVSFARLQRESNADLDTMITGLAPNVRYTNKSYAIQGGGTSYPEVTHPIGIPTPTQALIATRADGALPANTIKASWNVSGVIEEAVGDRIARSYVYTFVVDLGGITREGPPSPASNIAYTNDDEIVRLSNFPGIPSGTQVNKVRVYVSGTGGTFNYLKEIGLPVVTSHDITDNTFGEAIETELWTEPPAALKGVVAMANGFLAGFIGNNLYFSEPYQSHAWPEDYIKPMDFPIKGISAIDNMLYISTEGHPVIGVGNHPEFMSFTKLGSIQANVSQRSIANMGRGVMYASCDGVVMLAGGQATMVTENIISERVFKLLNPTTIHAYFYDDKYIAFYDTGLGGATTTTETGEVIPVKGAFILDPARRSVSFTTEYCSAAFSDTDSGKLFMVKNIAGVNNLYEFDEGATNLPLIWQSRPVFTKPMTFTCGKVDAKRYPVTNPIVLKLYGDNVLRHTQTVTSRLPFRLPGGYMAEEWKIHLSGDSIIDGVFLATSVTELV